MATVDPMRARSARVGGQRIGGTVTWAITGVAEVGFGGSKNVVAERVVARNERARKKRMQSIRLGDGSRLRPQRFHRSQPRRARGIARRRLVGAIRHLAALECEAAEDD